MKIQRDREKKKGFTIKVERDAIQDAIYYGIDVSLLYERIPLSPTERLERHQQILEFVEELKKARERRHGKG